MSSFDKILAKTSPEVMKVAFCLAVGGLSTYGKYSKESPVVLAKQILKEARKEAAKKS